MRGVELHLGVEQDFRPARKGHPAILVTDLDEEVERLDHAGQSVPFDADLPGFHRVYTHDPFGNRLEFLQPQLRWSTDPSAVNARRPCTGP